MSNLIVSNLSDGTLSIPTTYVTNGSAKAWVNFNGTGTIAARDSLNLSSLTDNAAGDYTVNFSSAFGTANYSGLCHQGRGTIGGSNLGSVGPWTPDPTTTTFRFITYNASFGLTDSGYAYFAAHGDLA